MSVLVDVDIHRLADAGCIKNFEPSCVEGASYDMRLGPQYTQRGKNHALTHANPTLVLETGEFAVLRSLEELTMPLTLIGHNGIMSPWAKRGLVSLFSPQIDPGFEGFLTVPVFNAGDSPISLNYGQKIFTVEFVTTTEPASYSWAERHGRQDRMDIPSSPSYLRPNLSDLAPMKTELKQVGDSVQLLAVSNRDMTEKVNVLAARLEGTSGRQNYNLNRWMLFFTVVGFVLGLVAVVVSVVSSDFLRAKIGFGSPPVPPAASSSHP